MSTDNITKTQIQDNKSLLLFSGFRAIKVPLKNISNNPEFFEELAIRLHDLVTFGYELVYLYITDCFENNIDILPICKKTYLYAMQILSNDLNFMPKDKQSEQLFDVFKRLFRPKIIDFSDYKFNGLSALMDSVAVECITSYKNNIFMHFHQRLKRVIYLFVKYHPDFSGLDEKMQNQIPYKVLNAVTNRQLDNDIPNSFIPIVKQSILDFIPGNAWKKSYEYDLKSDTNKFLLPTLRLEHKLEELLKRDLAILEQKKKDGFFENKIEENNITPTLVAKVKKNRKRKPFKRKTKRYRTNRKKKEKPTYDAATKAEFDIRKKYKSFQAVPLRTAYVPCYFKMHTFSLLRKGNFDGPGGIPGFPSIGNVIKILAKKADTNLKEIPSEEELDEKSIEMRKIMWGHYLNLDHKIFRKQERKGFRFFNTILTDGFGCTLLFVKKGKQYVNGKLVDDDTEPEDDTTKEKYSFPILSNLSNAEKLELLEGTLIGCDPGTFYMSCMVDNNPNGNPEGPKTYYCCDADCKRETMAYKTNATRRKILKKAGVTIAEQPLSKTNKKILTVESLCEYIKTHHEVGKIVKPIYQNVVFRKLKYYSKMRRTAWLQKLPDKIEKEFGRDAVLLYGNWSQTSNMKGLSPTPGKAVKMCLARRFRTFDIDEYGTSKYCSRCYEELEHLKYVDKNGKTQTSYRLLICRECSNQQGQTVNIRHIARDNNGASGCLMLGIKELKGEQRPDNFTRGFKKKKENPVPIVPPVMRKKINTPLRTPIPPVIALKKVNITKKTQINGESW